LIGEFDPFEFEAIAPFQRLRRALAGLFGLRIAAGCLVDKQSEDDRAGEQRRGGG